MSDSASKLGMWEGRWTYSERDYETPYSHTRTNTGTANCKWAPNRGFMICDYHNSGSGNGVPTNDIAVLSYSSATHTYAHVGVFKDRKPFVAKVTVHGNSWVTSANIPYKARTLLYKNVHAFSGDGKHAYTTTDISADNGKTWTTMSRFTAAKVGP
ncbi:MAG: hypothetical protein ABSE64_00410 [Vulcanimicrobiaceae bacterium]